MLILPGDKKPFAIHHGSRPLKSVYVGSKLVWPEADRYGIRSASLCKTHSAFVLHDGTFWTAGSNQHGQLCRIGPSGSWACPNLAQVPGIEDAVSAAVACNESGEGATVLLREHGRIDSAGANPPLSVSAINKVAYSFLGRESISGSPTFCNFSEVFGTYYVKKAWLGRGKLWIQRNDGFLYGYGLDWDANRASHQWMPVRDTNGTVLTCSDLSLHAVNPVLLRDDGTLATLGPIASWHRPTEFSSSQTSVLQPYPDSNFLTGIRKLSAGRSHLGAITENGLLRMAGSDRYGQLCSAKFRFRNPYRGHALDDPVSDIACGDNHTVILCRGGRVKTGGQNDRGQLGRAIPVGTGHDWLYCVGQDRVSEGGWYGNTDSIPGIEDALAVYAGGDGTIIVCKSGVVVCGDNEFGQLGIATENHIVNSDDRTAWRESREWERAPFLTNTQNANLFS